MLYIDEDKVKIFLAKNKSKIEIKRYSGIAEILSGLSLFATAYSSDFERVSFMSPQIFRNALWIIAIVVVCFGIFLLIQSFSKHYSVERLYDEFIELSKTNEHVFNIILIKENNSSGRYLLYYSKRWRCKLFPNYHALEGQYDIEKECQNIKRLIRNDIGILESDISLTHIGELNSTKYSYGDRIEKNYVFHFYSVDIPFSIEKLNSGFIYNGRKFYWLTLDQMYSSRNIVKKDKDVLDYVRTKQGIA